jgi:hypothetical protein
MSHVVMAQLTFENRRDAEECVQDMKDTVYNRCTAASYEIVKRG